MSGLRLRTVDAFTDRPFTGNPAAVVILDSAAPDEWMAAIARETNVSDTGFVLSERLPDADFQLRWFTRGAVEVDLCGHATLASAHCLFEDGLNGPVRFATRSGILTVNRGGDGQLAMDLPASPAAPVDPPPGIERALAAAVEWTGLSGNGFLLARVSDERTVRRLEPDIAGIASLPVDVIVVTAHAEGEGEYDFVSRVFAPKLGLDEDPVTGSAHTVLAPYWSSQLGRTTLTGLQASTRSGVVGVQTWDDRVTVSGRAVTVFDGFLSTAAYPT